MPESNDPFGSVRALVSSSVRSALEVSGLEAAVAGGRTFDNMLPGFNPSVGFWQDPAVSNKPPRFVLTIKKTASSVVAGLPAVSGSRRLAHANTANRSVSSLVVRVVPAIESNAGSFSLHSAWEWLFILVFPQAIERGSAAQLVEEYDPVTGTILYMGRRVTVAAAFLCPITPGAADFALPTGEGVAYADATDAIARFLSGAGSTAGGTTPVHGIQVVQVDAASLQEMTAAIRSVYATPQSPPSAQELGPSPDLIGISAETYQQINVALAAGKRHLLFYGPPGTGKTTLAQYVASQLHDEFATITGSADWSSQDLIGGYQPVGGGKLRFVAGFLVSHFDKPVIIDELNRCDIDKAIGPLFTVLSGQRTVLPYAEDPSNPSSPRYSLLPVPKTNAGATELCPTENWRLLATINSIDKASLYQMSYALSRRFAWILVDLPEDLDGFIRDYCRRHFAQYSTVDAEAKSPIGSIWTAVNDARHLGPAPFIDVMRALNQTSESLNLFGPPGTAEARSLYLAAFYTFVSPLLDGIRSEQAARVAEGVNAALGLTPNESEATVLRDRLSELSA